MKKIFFALLIIISALSGNAQLFRLNNFPGWDVDGLHLRKRLDLPRGDPSLFSTATFGIMINSANNRLMVSNGTSWSEIIGATAGVGDTLVTLSPFGVHPRSSSLVPDTLYFKNNSLPESRYILASRDTTLWTDSTLIDKKYFTDRLTVASYITTTTADARYPQLLGSYINPSWITSLPWSKITATPTTIAGYGITDFNSLGDARWSLLSHNHTLDGLSNVTITSKATNDLIKWNGSAWVNFAAPYLSSFTESDPLYTANGVPQTRTLTINGTALDLSANRSWIIAAGTSNSNIGAGYRIAAADRSQLKTLFPGSFAILDSTTNTNGITINPDTSKLLSKSTAATLYQPYAVSRQTNPTGAWTARTNPGGGFGSGSGPQGVCWGDNIFVAVGDVGAVASSYDGITWTIRTSANTANQYKVAYSPSLHLFVSCATTNNYQTSPDGITWTARSTMPNQQWLGITWAPGLSLFVACAATGTNRICTSPDGITWTLRTMAVAKTWWDVAWSPSLNLLVAVSNDGGATATAIVTSPDGITWTSRTVPTLTLGYMAGVDWSPTLGMFVSCGYQEILYSTNGTSWTNVSVTAGGWHDIAWAPEVGLFAAVGTTGTNRVMTSPDGITWTQRTTPATSDQFWGVAWSPSLLLWVAVASSTGSGTGFLSSPLPSVVSPFVTGTATLVAGTVTISNTAALSSSKIFLTVNTPAGTQGFLSAPSASIVSGTSFVINSTSATETSTVNWQIVN